MVRAGFFSPGGVPGSSLVAEIVTRRWVQRSHCGCGCGSGDGDLVQVGKPTPTKDVEELVSVIRLRVPGFAKSHVTVEGVSGHGNCHHSRGGGESGLGSAGCCGNACMRLATEAPACGQCVPADRRKGGSQDGEFVRSGACRREWRASR